MNTSVEFSKDAIPEDLQKMFYENQTQLEYTFSQFIKTVEKYLGEHPDEKFSHWNWVEDNKNQWRNTISLVAYFKPK